MKRTPEILAGALASLLNEREELGPYTTAHPTGLGQWTLYVHPRHQHPPPDPVTLQETDEDERAFPAERAGRALATLGWQILPEALLIDRDHGWRNQTSHYSAPILLIGPMSP